MIENGRGEAFPTWNGLPQARAFETIVVRLSKEAEPFFTQGEERAPLEWSERHGAYTFRFNSHGFVKILWREGGVIWEETLEVVAGALGADALQSMVQDLGEMALNLAGLTVASTLVGAGKDKGPSLAAVTSLSRTTEPLLDALRALVDATEHEWPTLERHPCRDLVRRPGPVRLDRSASAKHLLLRQRRPELRSGLGLRLEETLDTLENQWVKQLVATTLPRMIGAVRARAEAGTVLTWTDERRRAAQERCATAVEKCDGLLRRVARLAGTPFLQEVSSPHRALRPTKRLLTRPGYAGLYRVARRVGGGDVVRRLERLTLLRERLAVGGVRKLSNAYELWCLFRLYGELRQKLGFEPVGPQPQDEIQLDDGRLSIRGRQTYGLRRRFADGEIKLTLYYDVERTTDEGPVRPDFFLKIEAPPRRLGRREFFVVLDAKYHEYRYLGGRRGDPERLYTLRNDVEKVALAKYANRLGVGASFILHPCGDFAWLGERPYGDFLSPGGEAEATGEDWLDHPGHRLGALPLRPGAWRDKDMAALLVIVFHYHMGLTGLCLNCGRELCGREEYLANTPWGSPVAVRETDRYDRTPWDPTDPETRFRAVCRECGNSWRVSFCRAGTPIGKTRLHERHPGRSNRIVRPGPRDGSWVRIHHPAGRSVSCPRCGEIEWPDDPEPS